MLNKFTKSAFNKIKKSFITCVVWDFDGTLWKDTNIGKRIKNEFLNFTQKQVNQTVSEDVFDALTKECGRWSVAVSKLTNFPEEKIITQVENSYNRTQDLSKNSQLVISIEQLTFYQHVILTNSTKRQVEKGLTKIGFNNKGGMKHFPFEAVIDRKTMKCLKPNPKAFKAVLNYTQRNKNAHLMIGDSYYSDIDPAKKFGFQAIHIDNISDIFPGFNRI